MPQRRIGGVLAALCVAAAASGVLAVALLAPPSNHLNRSSVITRSGWPIADAFSSLGRVSWLADDPNTSVMTGVGNGTAPPPTPAPAAPAQPQPVQSPAPAPAPAPPSGAATGTFVAQTSGAPAAGEATGYGCAAAMDYLTRYAAPGFWLVCPGYARGHQAMTACQSGASQCSILRIIVIADPCPNAYMNEASNSWTLMGASDAPIDPYGACA